MRIAVIGAGLAGLACAEQLRQAGHAVVLFEKSRGVGGRMATRRVEIDHVQVGFDHGAQYMTARDPAFLRVVHGWEAEGLVARWPAAGEDAWVGIPGMNAPARSMADRLDVRRGQRVTALECWPDGWHLRLEHEQETAGPFEAAIVALPAEQAAALLAQAAPDWAELARRTPSSPCWTVMATFGGRLPVEADVIKHQGPIGWAARNSARPGHSGPESWVIQAEADWSSAHLELDPDVVAERLLGALGVAVPATLFRIAHRWRYARSGSAGRTALWDAARGLGVCGDWLVAPRVEGAFLSGIGLAERLGFQGATAPWPAEPLA